MVIDNVVFPGGNSINSHRFGFWNLVNFNIQVDEISDLFCCYRDFYHVRICLDFLLCRRDDQIT